MRPRNNPCGLEERANNLRAPFYLLPLGVKRLPWGTLTSPYLTHVIWALLAGRNPMLYNYVIQHIYKKKKKSSICELGLSDLGAGVSVTSNLIIYGSDSCLET